MTEYGLLYEAYLRGACSVRVCGARVVGVRWACAVGVQHVQCSKSSACAALCGM